MSGESASSSRWLIGCLVVGLLLLLICGGGIALLGWFTYRTAERVGAEAVNEIAEQMRQEQFAAVWQPPDSAAGPDVLFPENVTAWRRTHHDEAASIPELGLDRDGRHARYESGIVAVDVYAYEVAAAEQSAVFEAADRAIDAGDYTTRVKTQIDDGTSHRMTFSFSPPERYGRMWWSRGWLFVIITDDAQFDLDSFLSDYLTAVQDHSLETAETLDQLPTLEAESAAELQE